MQKKTRLIQLIVFLTALSLYALTFYFASHYAIPKNQLGLKAHFYPNRYLEGDPVESWDDQEVDGNDRSHGDRFRGNNFSVTWRTYLPIAETGTFIFNVLCDDGARLTIDEQVVLDLWYDHPILERRKQVELAAGWHEVLIEWYEKSGQCAIRVDMGIPNGKLQLLGEVPVSINAPEDFSAESARAWLRHVNFSRLSLKALTPSFLLTLITFGLLLFNLLIRFPSSKDRRNLNLLVGLFILGFTLFFLPQITGSGYHSFVFIRSLTADFDLSFTNDYRFTNELVEKPTVEQYRLMEYEDASIANPAQIGVPALWTPTFFIGHLITRWLMIFKVADVADGTTLLEVVGMLFGSSLVGFLAIILIYFTLRLGYKPEAALPSVIALWFGMFAYFMFKAPSLPHTTQTFTTALFLFFWLKDLGARTSSGWWQLGIIAVLMLWTGIICAPYLLLPLAEWYWALRKERVQGVNRQFILFVVMMVVAWLVQMSIKSHVNAGVMLLPPSTAHVSGLWALLVSTIEGIFIWFPISLLGFIGLLWIPKASLRVVDIFLGVMFLLYVVVAAYTEVDDIPFGQLNMIAALPLLALGLANLLDRFRKRPAVCVFVGLSVVYYFFIYSAHELGSIRNITLPLSTFLYELVSLTPRQVYDSWTYSQFVNTSSLLVANYQFSQLLILQGLQAILILLSTISAAVTVRWLILPKLDKFVQ